MLFNEIEHIAAHMQDHINSLGIISKITFLR